MKTKTKVGIALATAVTAGTLSIAIPSLAHDRGGFTPNGFGASADAPQFEEMGRGKHIEATLEATVTAVPDTVTEGFDAARGGYFTAYLLADGETTLPAAEPATGGRVVMIHPERNEDGTVTEPTLEKSVLTGVIDFHAQVADTTSYYALYPSDGSAAILVKVVVDADGVATATASSSLTVAYSADVAAQAPVKPMGKGGHGGRGGHGPRGNHGHGGEMGFQLEQDTSTKSVAPNA